MSNNVPQWHWFWWLFQDFSRLFHLPLLECIYWHTVFSPSTTPSASLLHRRRLILHTDSNPASQRYLCTRSTFSIWIGGGGGAGKESKASKFLAVKRVAWFLLDSVFEAKFCFQSNTANSHWPQQESWVSIWGQSLSPSFFLWIKERETACSRITKSKLMHQTHLLLHIHFVHTHILPCTCYFTFVCETKTQEHVSLPFLRTVNQISESSKFLLIGVRLIKTVLDTALHPSFLDALLLSEWNLLHKVLVLAGTSWQCHTQQRRCWASRWYGDGMSGEGNLIANVIAQGKTEIPPLF